MMDLQHEFETETGQGVGYLEGKEDPEDNGTYNDEYVEWLEQRLVDLLPDTPTKHGIKLIQIELDNPDLTV